MSILKKIKPKFWDHYDAAIGSKGSLSFRRKWMLIVLLTSIVALTPLIIMTLIDYRLTREAIASEIFTGTSKVVSSAWRSVSHALAQRKSALDFVVRDNTNAALVRPGRLASILRNLNTGIGQFEDICLADKTGNLKAHAGYSQKKDASSCDRACFQQVVAKSTFVGDVSADANSGRKLVVAIRHDLPGGDFFVLSATLKQDLFTNLLAELDIDSDDDAFIVNTKGILQTPSRFYGPINANVELPMPGTGAEPNIVEVKDKKGTDIILGYARIPETPFVFMMVKPKAELLKRWFAPRLKLVGFLFLSIAIVFLAILGAATFLVHRIHASDRKRIEALHQVEYTNKLASIGRLAAGVAHQINNPLEIINQKAGLIKDLFTISGKYESDEKLMGLVGSILDSVVRAGSITKRLLNFTRHMDARIESVDLGETIKEVLGFLEKEAERRDIKIEVDVSPDITGFESNLGSLQQIFLNLFNNAFAAMSDGGHLTVSAVVQKSDGIVVRVADDGCGIPEQDLKQVFEPFFSTQSSEGSGTGLGLSITYGLVKEIGGDIQVQSNQGEGTIFLVTLPRKITGLDESELL
jgi:two-component system, NtrC family, sensor kinase